MLKLLKTIYKNRMASVLCGAGIYLPAGLDGSNAPGLYVGDHHFGTNRGKRHGRYPGSGRKDAGLRAA